MFFPFLPRRSKRERQISEGTEEIVSESLFSSETISFPLLEIVQAVLLEALLFKNLDKNLDIDEETENITTLSPARKEWL